METTQTPGPGYFETYKNVFYSYFHPKTLSPELARMLHAPSDELHPSVCNRASDSSSTSATEGNN